MSVDYRAFPCTCGHAEGTHRWVLGRCRAKNCTCPRFLNRQYVAWFRRVVKQDMKRLRGFELDLDKRLNEVAGCGEYERDYQAWKSAGYPEIKRTKRFWTFVAKHHPITFRLSARI